MPLCFYFIMGNWGINPRGLERELLNLFCGNILKSLFFFAV